MSGQGARMLAATLAWEELISNGDRLRCIELARFALEDGQLQRVDTGLLWVVAAFTQEMGEVDMGDFWDRTLADAFARGSLFSALSVHLWRGHMLWHHGQLREALRSVHASNEQSEAWGAPAVGVPYGQAFIIGILLEQGEIAEARRYVDGVLDQPRIGDGARLFNENHARLMAAEGRHAEALEALEAATTLQTSVVNPVWRPWRTYRAPVLAGARPGRGGPGPDGRGGAAGAALGSPLGARPHPALRRRAGRRGLRRDAPRGLPAAAARRSRATSGPAPSWRWPG